MGLLLSWIESANTNDRELEDEEVEYEVSILTSGMTQEGGKLLQQIMGRNVFAYPKPLSLVRSLVRAATRDGDIVLDSFAGTGTTGHAVLDLNAEDSAKRRFVLIEMDAGICKELTLERLSRVISGYSFEKNKGGTVKVEGLGGGYQFCELGEPLFDEAGKIRERVRFAELASHVFFSEAGIPLPKSAQAKSPLIGVSNGRAIYLLFNGILGDASREGGNVLTVKVLNALPPYDGPKVVYGEGCLLSSQRLTREGITFKQIPYQIRTS